METPSPVRITNFRSLVFWAAGIYLFLQFIDSIAVIVLIFTIAFLFAVVLDRPIRWLDRRGLSRGMSAAVIALALLTGIGLAFYFAIPPLVNQASVMLEQAPEYGARIQDQLEGLTRDYPQVREYIEAANLREGLIALGRNFLPQVGRYSLNLLSGFVALFLVLVITLYAVAQPEPLVRGAIRALPRAYRRTGLRVLSRVSDQLQAWVRATFWMMLVVGVMSGVGLWALGVKSPLLFGLLAGIGEAIPTIGPILSAIPPFLVTLADDPVKSLGVLVLFLVVQQVENNLLVPRIMASTLKLHPVSVLFFVVAMGTLIGPIGILLSTPLCAITKVVYEEVYRRRILNERIPRWNEADVEATDPSES